MKLLRALCFLVLVTACGPVMHTDYEIVPPRTEAGGMCANNCLMWQANCRQQCQSQEQHCESMARMRAQSDYMSYVARQEREGRPATRTEADFYRRHNCDTNCETACIGDYHICHTNCGGQIIPHTYCTAFCD